MSASSDKRRDLAGTLGSMTGTVLGSTAGAGVGMWVVALAAVQLGYSLNPASVVIGAVMTALSFSTREAAEEWRAYKDGER